MLKTIKVKFSKGSLEPMEQLDIKEALNCSLLSI